MVSVIVIALVVIVAAGAFIAYAAIRGLGKAKTDGWSPAEALLGRKIWSQEDHPREHD
jgi:hypothetical protein